MKECDMFYCFIGDIYGMPNLVLYARDGMTFYWIFKIFKGSNWLLFILELTIRKRFILFVYKNRSSFLKPTMLSISCEQFDFRIMWG